MNRPQYVSTHNEPSSGSVSFFIQTIYILVAIPLYLLFTFFFNFETELFLINAHWCLLHEERDAV
jgi:hypothetical protein